MRFLSRWVGLTSKLSCVTAITRQGNDMLAGVKDLMRDGESRIDRFAGMGVLASADTAVLDAIPVALYVCDADGVVLRANRHAAELWGWPPGLGDAEMASTGHRLFRLGDRDLSKADTTLAEVLRSGGPAYGIEAFIERADGARRIVLMDIEPLKDEQGRVTGAISCLRDITARKQADDALLGSRQDIDDFFENGAVGLHLVGADGTILRANRAEMDLLGYTADEYIGRPISDFHADAPVVEDILRRLRAGEGLDKYTARLRAKDGSIKHVQITSNARFGDGAFLNTRCFTVDVTEQHLAQEALREQDRQAREILNALPAAVYTTDAQGRITFFNEAAVAFSGRRPNLGTDEWCVTWRLYEPDGTPLPHDQCPMAVALREGRAVRGAEAIAERPDGTRVPFIPFPTPLRDASGAIVGAVNMLVDISARKAAEEEQQALIHELNHRVKNALATVGAIASQTFRTTPDPETFMKKFQGRILALSKAHDLLTHRRWTGLDFRELLAAELAPYGLSGSDRIRLEGPQVALTPRVALVLGMVVHELATNAAKYGAFSSEDGHVDLRWTLDDAPTGPRFCLLWKELGGPPVSAPAPRGFGSRVIERSITKDLGGAVQIDYDPAGLQCRAEFSLA